MVIADKSSVPASTDRAKSIARRMTGFCSRTEEQSRSLALTRFLRAAQAPHEVKTSCEWAKTRMGRYSQLMFYL
ncbi:hypothetical protein XH96_32940 [Bradyrhizobium sp. CCBAU 51765]|nr:hypothetical protein XH96_32940 [Bradyrhizobium sp. CCBAU 51765]